MKKLKVNLGQSLFEVVLAIAVVTLILTAVVLLATLSLKSAVYSRTKTQATRFSQEAVEWLRGERDNNYADFQTRIETPTWCLADLDWNNSGSCGSEEGIPGTPFKRELGFTLLTESGKKVIKATVVVFWEDSQELHETRSITYFTDWRQR